MSNVFDFFDNVVNKSLRSGILSEITVLHDKKELALPVIQKLLDLFNVEVFDHFLFPVINFIVVLANDVPHLNEWFDSLF